MVEHHYATPATNVDVLPQQHLHDTDAGAGTHAWPGGLMGCGIEREAAGEACKEAFPCTGTKDPSAGGALMPCIRSAGKILSPRCKPEHRVDTLDFDALTMCTHP